MSPSRPRKRKRKQKREPERHQAFEALKQRVKQSSFDVREVIVEPEGAVRMSEVLSEFVEPYVQYTETEEDYRKVLTLATLAWNASFLPEEQREDMITDVMDKGLSGADADLKAGLRKVVDEMIARKQVHFAEYRRDIIDFELIDTGEGYHLTVASTMEEIPG